MQIANCTRVQQSWEEVTKGLMKTVISGDYKRWTEEQAVAGFNWIKNDSQLPFHWLRGSGIVTMFPPAPLLSKNKVEVSVLDCGLQLRQEIVRKVETPEVPQG